LNLRNEQQVNIPNSNVSRSADEYQLWYAVTTKKYRTMSGF